MLSPTQVYQHQGKSAHDFKVSARGGSSTITQRKPASNTTNHPQTPPKTKSKKTARLSSNLSPTVSPSNKASKKMNLGKKGEKVKINRERWRHDEVMILLEVYKKWAKKLRHDKKKGTWALVKKQYTLRCKQENVSSKKDLKQIQDKIAHLTDQHKRVKDNSHKTGRGRMTFKYYSQMSEILDQRQSVVPRNLSEVLPTKKISSTPHTQELTCSQTTSRASIPPTITTQATEPPASPPQGTANFDETPASPPQGTANFDELSGQEDDTEVNDSDIENDSEDMEMENTNPEDTNRNNKKMTKEGALKDLVTTLKSEMAKQTAEIRQQNENFQKAADADRVILEKLADGYQAECEANARLASALTDFMNRN